MGSNIYKEKRLEAAKRNKQFRTRKSAVELMPGISEECLKNYETGRYIPPEEVVVIMAEAYNAPDLKIWYCEHECKIGCDKLPVKTINPEHGIIRIGQIPCAINLIEDKLINIYDDGIVTDQEALKLIEIKKELYDSCNRIEELILAISLEINKKAPQESDNSFGAHERFFARLS